MELDIDQGNTRLKWRLSRQNLQYGSLDDLLKVVRNTRLNHVRMVSVLSNARQQQLINMVVVTSKLPLQWSIAKSTAHCMGITNGYTNPSQLGADRWCALVAAALEFQPPAKGLAVVGCGSACTVDIIDANKRHLGGWIAPGLFALGHGLRQCTNLSFDLALPYPEQPLGSNTNQAIALGCKAMAQGLLSQLNTTLQRLFDTNWVLVLHGGDAATMAELIPSGTTSFVVPELVFDGLAYVCGKQRTFHSPLA